jgi:type IV secretory pathway TrbD component
MTEHPIRLIATGFALLLAGAVLPFVMVIGLVESTLFLNLLAVIATISGITVGFLGMALYRGRSRPRR